MVTKQCPPQEELEFQLVEERYPDRPELALPADITSKWLNDNAYEPSRRALRVTLDSPFGLDVVYQEGEFADPILREGLLTGGVNPSNEWNALTLDEDGRLRVDAKITLSTTDLEVNLDAEDGDSVGIYGYVNGDPNTPYPVNVDSQGNLRFSPSSNINATAIYNEVVLASGTENVLITYTIPASTFFSIFSIKACGRSDAIFKLKINSNTIETRRNNWCDRNIEFNFQYGLPLSSGDIIALTVLHNELTSIPFNATIYGEEK